MPIKKMIKILPTITTTPGSDWKNKIAEINELKLREVALFFTFLDKETRKELYQLLEKSCIVNIPFVHLRSDMNTDELDYFVGKYNTKVFNTHTVREFLHDFARSKHRKNIFIENTYYPLEEKK